jgi:protein-L-isoaspartate(D-aspartate) O-methyltransferase
MSMADQAAEMVDARHRMVRKHLQSRGIHDRRLLDAMSQIPRERFVPPDLSTVAYEDRALPIGQGQTISQPYIVALMTAALELTGGEHVLEIGTGSGYQTAILAALAADVVSIERHAALSRQAQTTLTELGVKNVTLIVGDGTQGWRSAAPYDRVIVTAAAAACPAPLFEQLAEGGTLIIPLGTPDEQVLSRIRKLRGEIHRESSTRCRFVPLVGGA